MSLDTFPGACGAPDDRPDDARPANEPRGACGFPAGHDGGHTWER